MKKKTVIAAGVMILAILAAIPLGARRSMDRLYEEAKQSYYYDDTGYALYQGLETRQEAASNLITVARRYTGPNPELEELVDQLEYRVKQAKSYNYNVDDLLKEAGADAAMETAARALYEGLEQVELSEKDRKYPRQLLADLESEGDKIARSSYNDDARAYNAKLEEFPVSLFRNALGIRTMAVFEAAQ